MAVPPGFRKLFLSAAESGNVSLLQSLSLQFENGEGPGKVLYTELKTPGGRNALHLAAGSGTAETCTFLIEVLGFGIDGTCDRGETPLFAAIIEWNWSTAIFLINSGAEVTRCNNFGDTPMHCAASSGSKEIAKLLISKGADVNATSQRGTPLSFAACSGHLDVLKYLLEHNADPNLNTLSVDMTPLIDSMLSKPKPHIECMKVLLEAGADPNRLSYGRTPLWLAAIELDEDAVRCLLKAGADANISDFVGYTPLDYAALLYRHKVVEILFPVTSRIARYPDWSIRGVMEHAKSTEAMAHFITKQKQIRSIAQRKGEEAFRRKSYFHALNWFTQAVMAGPTDAKLLSNRSLCFVKIDNGLEALKAAQACVALKPCWAKAHYREGAAWTVLKDFKKAGEAFSRALALDPGNEEIEKAYRAVQAELN